MLLKKELVTSLFYTSIIKYWLFIITSQNHIALFTSNDKKYFKNILHFCRLLLTLYPLVWMDRCRGCRTRSFRLFNRQIFNAFFAMWYSVENVYSEAYRSLLVNKKLAQDITYLPIISQMLNLIHVWKSSSSIR